MTPPPSRLGPRPTAPRPTAPRPTAPRPTAPRPTGARAGGAAVPRRAPRRPCSSATSPACRTPAARRRARAASTRGSSTPRASAARARAVPSARLAHADDGELGELKQAAPSARAPRRGRARAVGAAPGDADDEPRDAAGAGAADAPSWRGLAEGGEVRTRARPRGGGRRPPRRRDGGRSSRRSRRAREGGEDAAAGPARELAERGGVLACSRGSGARDGRSKRVLAALDEQIEAALARPLLDGFR